MAQIRKFSNGGGSPEASTTQNSPKKPYKITVDGKTFDLDDDDIYRWSQSVSSDLSAVGGQAFQDVVNAIKRGTNVHYNSATNTFSGVNFSNKDIVDQLNANRTNPNQRQARRQLRRWAKRDYRIGDERQDHMVDTANFMKYNFAQPVQQTQETTPELISLYNSNGRSWDYNTNDDGTVSYSSGPQNAGNMTALNNFITMLGMSEEDASKKYGWDGYDTQISDLRNWYTQNQNYDWEGLRNRIRENQLSDNDWDLLSWMGFTQGNESSSTSKPKTTARSYEGSGFNDDILEQLGYYVRKGDDGNTYLLTASTDSEGNVTYTPVTQNMYLIGDNPLVKGTQWENGALYNGRFYTTDQIFNQNTEVTTALSPLFDQLRAVSDPEQARQILANSGWNVYGVQNPLTTEAYTAGQSYLRGFNDLLNNGTYYVTDISNQYNLPETSNLIAFFDPNNRNQDGTFRASYAINHDGASQIFDNQEALQNYLSSLNITPYEGYNPRQSLGVYNMITENGKRYIQMPDPITVGSGSDARQHNIYRDEEGNYYIAGLKGMQRLTGNKIIEAIKNGTVTEQQLKEGTISSLPENRPKWYDWLLGNVSSSYIPQEDQDRYNPGQYDSYFKFYKEGGKIPVLQVGGLISKGKIFDGTNDTEARKVGEATKAFGASKELKTDADKWAKAAGFLDTGGAALSFIPGVGNIAGAATGIAGSVARFTADAKRDGLDWGDARRLITNLGLDVLTLIPGAGVAAKAAKVGKTAKAAKALQKTGKILQATAKPLSIAGTIGGASAVIGAVADGDGEFTSEDFAQLGQGILGMAGGLKNIKQLNKEARLVKELAGKVKTPDLKETKELKWYKKPGAWISNQFNSGKSGASNNVSARLLAYNPAKQEQMLAEVVKKGDIDLKSLVTDKKGNINQKHLDDLKNVLGRYLESTGQTMKSTEFNVTGTRVKPWWFKGNQHDLELNMRVDQTPRLSESSSIITPTRVRGRQNPIPQSDSPITTPPPVAGLLPKGNGRFFSKVQKSPLFGYKDEVLNPLSFTKTTAPDQTLKSMQRSLNLHTAQGKKRFEQSPERLVGDLLSGKFKSSDELLDYIVTNIPKNKQQAILDLLTDKKAFNELMSKVASLSGYPNYASAVNAIPSWFKFKRGGKIVKAQNGDWTGYWGDPTKVFNQTIDTRPFPLRVPTSTTQSTNQPYTLVMNNTNTNPYFNYERGGIKFDSNGNVDWNVTYDTNSDYMKYRKYYIDNWNKDSFKDVKQAYLNQLATKGRKSGTVPMDMSLDEFMRITNDKRLGYAHDLYTDAFANAYPTAPQIDTNVELPAEAELQVDASSPITGSTDIAPVDYVDSNGKIIPGSAWSGLRADEYTPKLRGWNPDDLIGGIELARSLAMNTAMFNNYKKANKLIQKPFLFEEYKPYQDNITTVWNEQARNKRQFFVPTSTDALTNYAIRQTNEDAAQQLEMEGKLRASEAYSQWVNENLAARRAYAEDRRNTAFFNRQEMANKLMRDAQIDMQRKLANNQSIQNAVMEFRNKLNQDWNKRQAILDQYASQQASVTQDNALRDYFSGRTNGQSTNYYDLFANASDKMEGETFTDYMIRKYGDVYNAANTYAMNQAGQTLWDNRRNSLQYFRLPKTYPQYQIQSAKKGAKTPTYLQRHTGQKPDEAIWIQRNKDTAKAIEKLHDAVIKLFMKSIS